MFNLKEINGYKKWEIEPNTISEKAVVLTKFFHFETNNIDKERLVRVYLPSTYDLNNPNKRFPVIYMMDGKNLFDDYTSFVGEWGIDETIEDFILKKQSEGIIVVGIDAPKDARDRALEMLSNEFISRRKKDYEPHQGYAELLADFIFNKVKKDIDKTFHTLKDKKHTGVGGSSMGGIMAFFLATKYQKYVNYCFCFSPAFFLVNKKCYQEYLDKYVTKEVGNIYFYVGGKDFEEIFIKDTLYTYQYMMKKGFNHEQIKMVFDSDQIHNEKPWREYFPRAVKFFKFLN